MIINVCLCNFDFYDLIFRNKNKKNLHTDFQWKNPKRIFNKYVSHSEEERREKEKITRQTGE